MFRHWYMQALGLAVALLIPSAAFGATEVDLQRMELDQINRQYKVATSALGRTATSNRLHAEMLPLEDDSALTLIESSRDKTGRHYRYEQTFRGVPIFGKQITISESPNRSVRAMFGHVTLGLGRELPSALAKLPAAQAIDIAKRAGLGRRLGAMRIEDLSIRKMIYVDAGRRAYLAYIVSFYAEMPRGRYPTQPLVVINANTGRIIDQWDELASAQIGTGPGGNLKSGLVEYGTNSSYLDVVKTDTTCLLRNSKVRTFNFNNQTSGVLHSYPCPRNTIKSVNGAYSPLNDAHYFGTATYDMYSAYLGAPPLPFAVALRVHYGTINNAIWKKAAKVVNLGDGNVNRYPWAVLDIVAHEISHGFTDHNSMLIRNMKQSHAIDEAYADIAGEAAEFFLTGANDFMVGANVVKAANAGLRNMGNPTIDGKSIDHAENFVDGMDPHHASGVYNKAFYLLARKSGWDTKKAFLVFARANDLYWTSDISFNQGACGVEMAAKDLGYVISGVTSAFSAVGVSCGLVWDSSTSVGLYNGPNPIFSDADKTIASGVEPSNGEYGFASRASVYRNSGKRYVEFIFSRQTAATQYGYSGQICLSLRDQSRPVEGNAGGVGDWALCWLTEIDNTRVAVGPPWFRSGDGILWGPSSSGPLDAWRITEGDTIGIAADLSSGKLWYSLNGVWVGDPVAGAGAAFDQSLYGVKSHLSGMSVTPHLYSDFQNITTTIRDANTTIPSGFVPWGD